jgi:hypothetical protein
VAEALSGLRATELASHIAFLTHPDQEGRGLGSRGLEATARYVIRELRQGGLEPGQPGGYIQSVPLRRIAQPGGAITLTSGRSRWVARSGKTCVLPALAPQVLSGSPLFVGYGIQETAMGRDDFRGLAVRGRIVILIGGLPPGPSWQTSEMIAKYAGVRPEDRYDARLELLGKLGARAVIALESGLAARLAARNQPSEPLFLAASEAPAPDDPPLVRVDLDAAVPWLASQGISLEAPVSRELQSAPVRVSCTGRARTVQSPNVIARLQGTDPRLRGQALVLGAHMDHLGTPGGVLHPGADDNASGVAALLEIAKAFARRPPRRTVIFAFWTGEEDGKFGSGHYVRHPRWPLARTEAYLNLDMIGHPWSAAEIRKLTQDCGLKEAEAFLAGLSPEDFAEPGLADWAPGLGDALAEAAQDTGMALHLDRTDGRNGGSDYRDFARRRVPFIRFFGSYFPAYHEPGDTLGNLDPAQVRRMACLAFATAWALANR